MKTPAVVWDMGGIMFKYFTELLVDRGQHEGWPLEDIPLGPTGPATDSAYADLLEGRIDEPAYVRRVLDTLATRGIELDPASDLDWDHAMRPDTWNAIARIAAAGHLQAVLTNDASRWLGDQWWERWEHAKHFDSIVDVITLPEKKPAPGPYLAAARALGVEPKDCVFIDDLPVNCRGAEAVGMTSINFDVTNPRRAIDRLLNLLGVSQ